MGWGGGWTALLCGALVGAAAGAPRIPAPTPAVTAPAAPAPAPAAGPTGLGRVASAAARVGPTLGTPVPAPVPAQVPAPAAPAPDAGPGVGEAPWVPPPPPAVVMPSPPPAVVPAVAGPPPAGGTWAVVVGIDDYPGGGSDLRSAVNDAIDVDAALAGQGVPAANRLVLRDGQATVGAIRAAVDWLAARAGPDALAVFFFSGHVRKLGPSAEALVGADGDLLVDAELADRLRAVAARQAWIAIAGCYAGGFTEVLAPGRVLTAAAPADALAYESSLYGRSYLVQFMVREAMIEGRAPGSVQAAFDYANQQLARRHPDRLLVQFDQLGAALRLRPLAEAAAALAPPPTAPATPPPRRCLLLILCGGSGI